MSTNPDAHEHVAEMLVLGRENGGVRFEHDRDTRCTGRSRWITRWTIALHTAAVDALAGDATGDHVLEEDVLLAVGVDPGADQVVASDSNATNSPSAEM